MSQHELPTPPSSPRSRPIVTLEGNLFNQDGDRASEMTNRQQTALHNLTDAYFGTFNFQGFHSGDFILDLCPGEGEYTIHMEERGFVLLKNKYEWFADQGVNIEPDFYPPMLIRCGGKPWILASDFFKATLRALAHSGHLLLEFIDMVPTSSATSAWQKSKDLSKAYVPQLSHFARPGDVESTYSMLQAAGFVNLRVQKEILTKNRNANVWELVYRFVLDTNLRGEQCYPGGGLVEDYYTSYHGRTAKLRELLLNPDFTQLNLCRLTAQKPARG